MSKIVLKDYLYNLKLIKTYSNQDILTQEYIKQ